MKKLSLTLIFFITSLQSNLVKASSSKNEKYSCSGFINFSKLTSEHFSFNTFKNTLTRYKLDLDDQFIFKNTSDHDTILFAPTYNQKNIQFHEFLITVYQGETMMGKYFPSFQDEYNRVGTHYAKHFLLYGVKNGLA